MLFASGIQKKLLYIIARQTVMPKCREGEKEGGGKGEGWEGGREECMKEE